MADDQSSKRLKTASGASGEDASNARIDALESETHALRSAVARLDSEVALLRQQLNQQQGSHDSLPVVIPKLTPTVDISRLDLSLANQIASFVGTSRELLNLALTSKSFGLQQPATGLNWSMAEEVARQAVRSFCVRIPLRLPQYVRGRTTWLSILHESEHPTLKFDALLGRGIKHRNKNRTSIRGTTGIKCAAVANNYVMETGIHYAEFRITGERCYIGIVRPMPNLDPARFVGGRFHLFDDSLYDEFLAARPDGWGNSGNVHACEYDCGGGIVNWTNWDIATEQGVDWEGMENFSDGDTIGMLLNLDKGTLTVYRNSHRLGVMKDGLSGPYCWYVSVGRKGSTIAIKIGEPPMHPTQIMVLDTDRDRWTSDSDHEGIQIEGCGLSEINGYFRRVGLHDDCLMFCKVTSFRGREVVFNLLRCRLTDNTR